MRKFALRLGFGSAVVTSLIIACGGEDSGETGGAPAQDSGTNNATVDAGPQRNDGGGGGRDASAGSFLVGGKVNGLLGEGLVLQNNGGDDLGVGDPLSDAGSGGDGGLGDGGTTAPVRPFTFAKKIASGASYAVTVLRQPSSPAQTCTVASGAGKVGSGDVTNVDVTCATNTYTVGGAVTGLAGGESVVLQNNDGPNVTVSSNATFTAPNRVADGQTYTVTVKTPPAGKKCKVTSGTGTIDGANVTNVAVECVVACGDGIVDDGETCDDGNGVDVDACSNACTLNTVYTAGLGIELVNAALTTLTEPFTAATATSAGGSFVNAPASGVLITVNNGATGTVPTNWQTFLDAGGHIFMAGGSSNADLQGLAGQFLTLEVGSWHQSTDCTSDWNTVGTHPITQFMPATYEFPLSWNSYHIFHFGATQPAGTTLIGDTCHAAGTKSIFATRTYPSGGTFTYLALLIGGNAQGTANPDFIEPLVKGYLAWVRSKR